MSIFESLKPVREMGSTQWLQVKDDCITTLLVHIHSSYGYLENSKRLNNYTLRFINKPTVMLQNAIIEKGSFIGPDTCIPTPHSLSL